MGELWFSGITNEPFSSLYGDFFSKQLENSGIGFSKEVELIKKARKKDFLTVAWAMTAEQAKLMAESDADIIGTMIGVTSGGITGKFVTPSLEDSINRINEMIDAVCLIKPNTIFLTHGGPINDIESARESILKTKAHGYVAGSSGERIPTEKAIEEITREYKKIKTK